MKDTAEWRGLTFTWHEGLIQTQIDHILIPAYSRIDNFTIEPVVGSDYNLLFFQVKV